MIDPGGQLRYEISAKQEGDALHVQRKLVVGGIFIPLIPTAPFANFSAQQKKATKNSSSCKPLRRQANKDYGSESLQMFTRHLWRTAAAVALLLIAAGVFGALPHALPPTGLPSLRKILSLKDNPAEPGAAAMILYREEIINNKDFHDFYSEHFYRIKIFTDAGKKYADVEVALRQSYVDIKNIQGRTIHPDGKIIDFDGKSSTNCS